MPSPHSKRKFKAIEPITFDELRDAAGMSGFVSFLNLPPTDDAATPADMTPVVSAPVEATPGDTTASAPRMSEKGAATVSTRVVMTPADKETTRDVAAGVELAEVDPSLVDATPAAANGTADATTPIVVTPVVLPRRGTDQVLYAPLRGGKNLYHCYTAQDGHSHLEEALYQLLWSVGTAASADIRVAQVAQSDLARQLRLTDKNLRIALQRLVEKLTIEIVAPPDFALKTAKQYRVYSSRAIVERRRDAGLEWVIRNKGVQFVSREYADRYREAGTTPVDHLTTGADTGNR